MFYGYTRAGRVTLSILCLTLLCTSASAWTVGGDTYAVRYDHPIAGIAGAGTLNYCILNFTVSNATGDPAGNIIYTDGTTQADWDDVRFTTAADTVLPCWIESTNATSAVFWVNVTQLPEAGTTLRIYYDSDTATSASNGTATFPLCDDFNAGTTIDTSKWTVTGGVSQGSGLLTVDGTSGVERSITSKTTFGAGYVLRTRWKFATALNTGTSNYGFLDSGTGIGIWASSQNGYRFINYVTGYARDSANPDTNYHLDDIARNGASSIIFTRDGSVVYSPTSQIPSVALPVFGKVYNAGTDIVIDWIAVRPYLATEPAHSAYTLIAPPVAAFSADVTTGDAPLTVQFTDASTNNPVSWAWDFDNDGDTDSTDQNPIYEYADVGTYTVNLTATNGAGSDSEIKTDYITAESPYIVPVADFVLDQTSGYPPFWVSSLVYSTGPPTSYEWDFNGDGTVDDTSPNASYQYTVPGTYTVVLNVSNPVGFDVVTKPNYITVNVLPAAPVASFTADAIAGHAPLLVSFTDTSTGSPTAWAWDFDGDGNADSVEQNPTYTYNAEGTYTVSFECWNDGGSNLTTKTGYIYVGALTARMLRAAFSYSTPIGTAPFSVTFTDTSASNGTYARAWDFGDGSTSTEPAPVHEYATAGKYDVELVIASDYTQDKSTARKAVMAYPAAAVSPLPTTTFGAHMTEIMESNWNVSVIGPIIPRAYTDALTPLAGNTGVGDYILWGIIWSGVFMILFVRQGTSWLVLLLGLVTGGGILKFLPPEFAHVGIACAAIACGGFLVVFILGRNRST